jgi:DNA modification methylase
MTVRLLTGDCRDILKTLPDCSVHMVCTSPPYYGLRDYGTALWDGGDAGCDHKDYGWDTNGRVWFDGGQPRQFTGGKPFSGACPRCGARRIDAQIGLEPTPDAYLAAMVAVFREVRRVLRDDGTCWVNMGDSYSSGSGGDKRMGDPFNAKAGGAAEWRSAARAQVAGAKPKDLLMMPARLALALQADGWWVRSDIIWAKPNPMPESCRDRPTSAHEHIFLLTKRARYFYDADAVREPHTMDTEGVNDPSARAALAHDAGAQFVPGGLRRPPSRPANYFGHALGRNLRNVWTIATAPYAEAHFATFPPLLAERCIRAGTSERGCCAACGAPYVRQVERKTVRELADAQGTWVERPGAAGYGAAAMTMQRRDATSGLSASNSHNASTPQSPEVTTTGWAASCACGAETQPCTVLDPFAGSGTTLLVADRLQRRAIGIDLSTTYADMAKNRVTDDCPLFTSWAPAEDPEEARMADLFQDMAAD